MTQRRCRHGLGIGIVLNRQRLPWERCWPHRLQPRPQCEHPGCQNTGLACFFPGSDEPGCYYCAEHIHGAGFCWGCGNFWGGVETFDFDRRGLCDNCRTDPELAGNFADEEWHEYEEEPPYPG